TASAPLRSAASRPASLAGRHMGRGVEDYTRRPFTSRVATPRAAPWHATNRAETNLNSAMEGATELCQTVVVVAAGHPRTVGGLSVPLNPTPPGAHLKQRIRRRQCTKVHALWVGKGPVWD